MRCRLSLSVPYNVNQTILIPAALIQRQSQGMSATLEKREGLTATSVGREAWTSGGGSPHNHPGWDGQEPRVIYHDVLARVDMIKRRRVAASSVDDRSNGRREDSRYDCDEDEGEKRVVDVIFDPPGEISLGKVKIIPVRQEDYKRPPGAFAGGSENSVHCCGLTSTVNTLEGFQAATREPRSRKSHAN